MARDNEWMAEHMLILGVESPEGDKTYVAGAFPVLAEDQQWRCLSSDSMKGWKVSTVRRYRLAEAGFDWNPSGHKPGSGFFRVARDALGDKPQCHEIDEGKHPFYERTSLPTGTLGGRDLRLTPEGLIDWHGKPWSPESETPAAHPNARFTAPASQCPTIDPNWESPEGVPCQLLFSVDEECRTYLWFTNLFNWNHGVYLGATLASETTAAAEGALGNLRRIRWQCCLLRLQHGRLFQALDQNGQEIREAENLSRQLVSQGCRREVSLAGLLREYESPQMDCRAFERKRTIARGLFGLGAPQGGLGLVRVGVSR